MFSLYYFPKPRDPPPPEELLLKLRPQPEELLLRDELLLDDPKPVARFAVEVFLFCMAVFLYLETDAFFWPERLLLTVFPEAVVLGFVEAELLLYVVRVVRVEETVLPP